MQACQRIIGFAIAAFACVATFDRLGSTSDLLLQPAPLLLITGICIGGLLATHGITRLWRTAAAACSRVAVGDADELQQVCQQGYRLTWTAAALLLAFVAIRIGAVAHQPPRLAPLVTCALLGLFSAIAIAELGFAMLANRLAWQPAAARHPAAE